MTATRGAEPKQLILPTVAAVGGVASILIGQWQGWVGLALAVVLYGLYGLRRYKGIVL